MENEMFNNLKYDYKRFIQHDCASSTKLRTLFKMLLTQGVWAITIHRFGVSIRKIKIAALRYFLLIIWFILKKLVEVFDNIHISGAAELGPGFYIGHFSCFINVVCGANCSVGQSVTIGHKGGGVKGVPKLGDNVYVGSGAKILGPVKIGNNVSIGANAVVTKDIPDGATAVGIPARVIKIREINEN